MKIENIVKFLQVKKNLEFFQKLQSQAKFSINDIQKITSENLDKPVRDLLTQIEIQRKIRWKINSTEKLLFTCKGAEQASSQRIAAYNSSKFENYKIIADLCCGIGMDLMAIAPGKEKVYAVESDENTLLTAKYNCKVLGLNNIEHLKMNAEDFDHEVEAVYVDPDRRRDGHRHIDAEDYSPTFKEILELNKRYPSMAVKLSPLFKYRKLELDIDHTFEFVSENGTLKELLLCLGELSSSGVKRKAILLPEKLILTDNSTQNPEITEVKEYIYEPDPAIIRGGLVKELAMKIGCTMVAENSAILTAESQVDESFGKCYQVKEILSYSLKKLRKYLKNNEIGELVIKTRGFSESVESLRNKIRLKGKNSTIILIIKLYEKHKMLILSRSISKTV